MVNQLYINTKGKLKKKKKKTPGSQELGGRMDTCICMAESFRCSPETVTTLLIVNFYSCIHQYKRKGFKKTDSELPVQRQGFNHWLGK